MTALWPSRGASSALEGKLLFLDAYRFNDRRPNIDRFANSVPEWDSRMKSRNLSLDAKCFCPSEAEVLSLRGVSGILEGYGRAYSPKSGRVRSIDRVRDEIERGGDDLWNWVGTPARSGRLGFGSASQRSFAGLVKWLTWVQAQPQFLPQARAEFASEEVARWLARRLREIALPDSAWSLRRSSMRRRVERFQLAKCLQGIRRGLVSRHSKCYAEGTSAVRSGGTPA